MSDWNLAEPQRQSPIGVIVYILRNLRAMAAIFIFSIFSFGFGNPKFWIYGGLSIIPIGVLITLIAYLQYRNFTFHVAGDELIIHEGVIFKNRVVIAVDRIQAIQITEHIVQRVFGLVSLKVDTAGSKGNELEIPALERVKANFLKDLLNEKKEAVITEAIAEAGQEQEPVVEPGGRVLVHLGIWDLIKVGLTENHLKTGLVALGFVFGTFNQYQDFIERYFSEYFDDYAMTIANAGFALVLMFLFSFSVFSILLSLVRTVLRFFDLKATLKYNAVEINTGLLKRNQDRIPIRKIQFIEWFGNPLRRAVGYESAKIKPSNSVGEVSKKQSIEIPALKFAASAILAEGVFSGFSTPSFGFKANAAAYARISAIVASFFILPGTAVLYFYFGNIAFFVSLVYLPILFFSYQAGRRVRVLFDNKFLVLRRGWVFPVRIVMPCHKLQVVSFQQNIFLKRRGLCHLTFFTAAGSRSVRYLAEKEAFELYNYLVYVVERSEERWM